MSPNGTVKGQENPNNFCWSRNRSMNIFKTGTCGKKNEKLDNTTKELLRSPRR